MEIMASASIIGLFENFDSLYCQLTESCNRLKMLELQVDALRSERITCTEMGSPFTKSTQLQKISSVYDIEAENVKKLCNDLNETSSLIDQGIETQKSAIALLCDDSILWPELDLAKSTLRRSHILDRWLEKNKYRPVVCKLSVDQQRQTSEGLSKFHSLCDILVIGDFDSIEGSIKSLDEISLLSEAPNERQSI
jgi:hypothetical protein